MDSDDRVWREQGLRSAVLAGDERAWQAWYDASYERLYAYVSWRCAGLRDLADEVVQDTWLTAVRRIRSFDPRKGSFGGWLRGIAAHLLCNHLRRRAHRHGESLNGHTSAAAPAEAALEQRELAERIAQALAELPARYERALQAKYVDERSVADLAADWQESPKAIESLLTRARQAFREAYQRREHKDDG